MKKLLVTLLALGTLCVVPSAEARYRRGGNGASCAKQKCEKPCPKACAKACDTQCDKRVEYVGTYNKPCTIKGYCPVKCYKEITTTTTTCEKDRPFEECDEQCVCPQEFCETGSKK
jgi:hypothetical protein